MESLLPSLETLFKILLAIFVCSLILLCLIRLFVKKVCLSFMGVPINGSVKDFVRELKKKGLAVVGQNTAGAELTGTFAGYPGCKIEVCAARKYVYGVMVHLPRQGVWNGVKNDYTMFKTSLTKKYGGPVEALETFIPPYREGCGKELAALREGKCRYLAVFQTPRGTVSAYISPDPSAAHVVLKYVNGGGAAGRDDI